ncbi:MAG: GMC family oxidoreductase [Candidatus Obscuribacterales bacterium]|nr:GMC family oxidoreductase [Candidatus Obscuribacterales bacterium]
MIVDLNSSKARDFNCDICVVGSGAVGLALGWQLLSSGKSVLLLESGGYEHELREQELYRSSITGLSFYGAQIGRFRVIGGSTTRWGGQILPLEPLDFQKRDWVEASGWPIAYSDLSPYFALASSFLGSDQLNFDTDLLSRFDIAANPFDQNDLNYFFSKWSPHPDLRTVYLPLMQEAENLTLLYHANLTRIGLSETHESVSFLELKNQELQSFSVQAEIVILCLGGIENTRVLLANDSQKKHGIGNESGLLGKYLQDHPFLKVGTVNARDPKTMEKYFHARRDESGRGYTPRISITAAKQKELAVLNASAYLEPEYPLKLLTKCQLANLLRRVKEGGGSARQISEHFQSLLGAEMQLLFGKMRVPRSQQYTLCMMTEQEPSLNSFISLSDKRDRYGIPLTKIHWDTTEKTWSTVLKFSELIQKQFLKAGFSEIQFFDYLKTSYQNARYLFQDFYHHMGTTRMSASAETGIVDQDSKVFGLSNLYVISSSVFPTGGHSNPTFTTIALALRLLDKLELLKQES